jgi:hypothetical protein
MELSEFVVLVPDFMDLSQSEKVLHFSWYLHTQRKKDTIDQASVRACFKERHLEEPNLSLLFRRLIGRRPKVVLGSRGGIKLEGKIRAEYDRKYGQHETTIAVSKLLKDLIGKVSDEAERLFLSETIKCYHVKAFRAAIVMAWNLAYDHLLHWILADKVRLASFNSKISAVIGPKRGSGTVITNRESFEQLGEKEVLNICNNASLFESINTKKILDIQLIMRNLAAHPSLVSIDAPQADDTISSLVNNVVLILR